MKLETTRLFFYFFLEKNNVYVQQNLNIFEIVKKHLYGYEPVRHAKRSELKRCNIVIRMDVPFLCSVLMFLCSVLMTMDAASSTEGITQSSVNYFRH